MGEREKIRVKSSIRWPPKSIYRINGKRISQVEECILLLLRGRNQNTLSLMGNFQYWSQNDSPVHHNPDQFHEGEFQKFHKFCDYDLQKDGKKSPNRVTSKFPSGEKIVLFYSHLVTYSF